MITPIKLCEMGSNLGNEQSIERLEHYAGLKPSK
jgi:hypothetical protein